MENEKNRVSDAQKKYDKKTKMVSVKYTLSDMKDYNRLKNHLESTGQSVNAFIKGLINDFFESGREKSHRNDEKIKRLVEEKQDKSFEYYPFTYINEENIQYLYDEFGEDVMNRVLDKYYEWAEFYIEDLFEDGGCRFDEWIKGIPERISEDEFGTNRKEQIGEMLIKEMDGEFL